MKINAAIFIICIAQCMCLCTAAILNNGIKQSSLIEDIKKEFRNIKSDIKSSCIFGVQSVSVYLYTRNITNRKVEITEVCDEIDPSKPVIFLVHGFISSANNTISSNLAKSLAARDYTVFSLDWSKGACTSGLPVVKLTEYPFAVRNTREIGHYLARYAISLVETCNIPLKDMTFIGHSLGAHVSGFAAKLIQKSRYGTISRLYAADPAEPLFELNSCENRLCTSDAKNVIVLHTSTLGIPRPIGNVDLYFHCGYIQPGCFIDIPCSHSRSMVYLLNTLQYDCKFVGVPLSTESKLKCFIDRPSFPSSNLTDHIVMDDQIYNGKFPKDGQYYVFVGSGPSYCSY